MFTNFPILTGWVTQGKGDVRLQKDDLRGGPITAAIYKWQGREPEAFESGDSPDDALAKLETLLRERRPNLLAE